MNSICISTTLNRGKSDCHKHGGKGKEGMSKAKDRHSLGECVEAVRLLCVRKSHPHAWGQRGVKDDGSALVPRGQIHRRDRTDALAINDHVLRPDPVPRTPHSKDEFKHTYTLRWRCGQNTIIMKQRYRLFNLLSEPDKLGNSIGVSGLTCMTSSFETLFIYIT